MIGTTLGPYRIDRKLGSGGMGTVYAATGAAGATVAVKVIHPHLVADGDALARFRREAAVGISIRHANVVGTLAAGEDQGRHWLALEYVEGQSLDALRHELGTVPEDLCRHVAHEVAAGLAAIHAAGVVHRDLKPENVLITRDEVVKVTDLGVARSAEDDARLTQTGAFVGSLQYAAPEQFTGGGKGLDGRADLHALGVLLYELSAGANPYQDPDWRVVFQRVLKETPRRLGAVNPQVSPFFEEVVHTLLAKDRDARFASAAELASTLEGGEESPWWTARAKSIRGATQRPLRRIRIPRETALVGRDAEMAALRAAFEKAKSCDGQVVLVEGEAGIGKSRLVDEFVALLQREGEDLEFLHGSYPPGGAATASGAFTTAYREHFGEEGLAETLAAHLSRSPVLIPAFAALLRGETNPSGAEPLTKDSLQTCFVHATRSLAGSRPTIVLIDDLHFAPEEGRSLFAALAMAAPGHRILLVGTSRPPLDEKWASNLVRIGYTTRIQVGRLGARDLVALLKDALKSSQLAEELAAKVAEKTDGNPFFVFEVLRGLKDGQYLTQKPDGTWATTRVIHEIRIPSSIADMIQARVGDLSEDERSLLEIAACAGFEFDPALVGDVAGVGRIPLLKALGTIEKQHRLIRGAGRRYVFDHHQVQEHLYAGLTEFVREGCHAAIAESLERMTGAASKDPAELDGGLCAKLCEHFLKGAADASGASAARAPRYLEAALAHLTKGYFHGHVVALTDRALAVEGLLAGAPRAKALLQLASALDATGSRERQEACAREAVRLAEDAGDDGLRAQAATALGNVLARTSRNADAESAFRRALAIAQARGDRAGEAETMVSLAMVSAASGRLDESREHIERSLAISLATGDRRGEANAHGNLGILIVRQGRLAEAQERFERVLALRREIGDRRGEGAATVNLGIVFRSQGRLEQAREQFERGLAICRETGHRLFEGNATGNLGSVLEAQGRLAEAQAQFERGLEIRREIGDRQGEARAIGNVGFVLAAQGRHAEARERLERSLAISREIGQREQEADALRGLARVARDAGDAAESERRYVAGLEICERIGHRHLAAATRLALGSLRAATRGADSGRESLVAARDLARAVELPGVETVARCELAALPGGDAADALASFAAHDARLEAEERREARLLLWKATGDRAHLAEAKRLLDESLTKAHEEHRAAMVANVRLNREIAAAAAAL